MRRHRFAFDPEMQVPIDVPIIVEITPHERLPRKFLIQELVEECDNLSLVLRGVEVRRDASEVDALRSLLSPRFSSPSRNTVTPASGVGFQSSKSIPSKSAGIAFCFESGKSIMGRTGRSPKNAAR